MVITLLNLNKKHYLLILFFILLNGCSIDKNIILNKKQKQHKIFNLPITHTSKETHNFNYQDNKQSNNNYLEPLFEDYKPRNVGDILTIILQENTSASNSVSNNSIHNGNSNFDIDIGNARAFDDPNGILNKIELNSSIKNNFLGKGSSSANNTFVGLITVIVDRILPNGNLEVSGSKNITINDGIEKICFYGIVNPHTISKNNSVLSTKVANTNITYISSGPINIGSKINWLQRLFVSLFTLSK
ncbi:flagellar L-ring protein precursor [Buchnera aphidicola str. Bp (Baizongia pistaciae)]|uniref:Flagellar L-ring protein n=1 Tax=Buchnera aphidicola subsp. Baizongia pistaciae (strain Bp) TaxID=224915 RepID=FLGH_BUCBP|nr:flagellar basal body L-ring protein FlgH [Buchnera aphidicola]Q89AH6.1 RecName: Full=Flagellar L-ring protein; AltName: Full=Basal body L-ring protein; Flags: Precursor [Buchnera aphidicola str. Bp (Baizongia pistaciae)]AAO27036.1 flagellar L-ring protein precursor [Buchnera aphidicola str. Bp (Baizongia pistaciae)]